MKLDIYLLVLVVLFSCKRKKPQFLEIKKNQTLKNKEAEQTLDSIAYFENALIYQYYENGKKEELWIYVNEQKKELLYIPNDDMIQAVISCPDGTYKTYGIDEKGNKIVLSQIINAVSGTELNETSLQKTKQTKIISQNNIQQKDINCQGYQLKYLKMEGGETLFATTEIPINSFQLYGFSRLNGDCKLAIEIDYINVFKKNELLTHVERANFNLKLENYGPNPYEFNIKEYNEL